MSQGEKSIIETDNDTTVAILLHKPPDGLDHAQTVGGLHASSIQAVIKDRVFIGQQIQFGGMLHHPNADVAGVIFGEERVEEVDEPGQYAVTHRKGKFDRHQPPEAVGDCDMRIHRMHNVVDDELGHP